MVKYLNFLDKNVISLLDDVLIGKSICAKNQIDMLANLRRMDNKKYGVTPLFSLIEGRKSGFEDPTQKKVTIKKEIEIISKFFKNARTDTDFFNANIEKISDLLSKNTIELDETRYHKFLEEFYNKWITLNTKNSIPKELRRKFLDEMLMLAKNLNISLEHPIVMTAGYAIYGKEIGMLVLKPGQPNIHNAYNDIACVTRLSLSQASMPDIHLKFHTLDKGLIQLFHHFKDVREYGYQKNNKGGNVIVTKFEVKNPGIPKEVFNLFYE